MNSFCVLFHFPGDIRTETVSVFYLLHSGEPPVIVWICG